LSLKLPTTKTKKITDNFAIKKYLTGGYFKNNNSIIKSNKVIWHSIIGLSIFWAISQIVVAVFGAFLKSSAGVENTVIAQSLLAVGGLGIIVGSMIANKVSKNYSNGLKKRTKNRTTILVICPKKTQPNNTIPTHLIAFNFPFIFFKIPAS
jgi:hypothetical protein